MDARPFGIARMAIFLFLPVFAGVPAVAAPYRTPNFAVTAPTPALAKEIGDAAEIWRRKLSIEWIGNEMPQWSRPCPIRAQVAPGMGAGGATTFVFDHGHVFGWKMDIQGSRERVLDSVLPHEVTHTILACYFRQPVPRWADEGACTTVEHPSEIAKQERLLIKFLKSGKGISFSQMFAMKEYPPEVLPLYSQGHSLTQFLLERRGKPAFLAFLTDGMRDENWARAVRTHYGHENLYALQTVWLDWVKQGRPRLQLETTPGALAAASHVQPTSAGSDGETFASISAPATSQAVAAVSPNGDGGPPAAADVTPITAGKSVYAAGLSKTGDALRDASRDPGTIKR